MTCIRTYLLWNGTVLGDGQLITITTARVRLAYGGIYAGRFGGVSLLIITRPDWESFVFGEKRLFRIE